MKVTPIAVDTFGTVPKNLVKKIEGKKNQRKNSNHPDYSGTKMI